jgi:hypothetical protein
MDGAVHEHQPQPPKRVERPALESGDEDEVADEPNGDDSGGDEPDSGSEQPEQHEQHEQHEQY